MKSLPIVNLADLPLPPVIEPLDFETLFAAARDKFMAFWEAMRVRYPELPPYDVELLESDPVVPVLQAFAYQALLLRGRVNDAARALMLSSATQGDLDAFVADFAMQRLTAESDRDLRERRRLAPGGYGAAGPAEAYRFFAMSADASIKEALAVKGQDSRVDLVLLSRQGDGTVAGGVVAKVHDALSPLTTRPLTDTLYIRSADIVAQTIQIEVTVPFGPDAATVLAKVRAGVAGYCADRHAIGRVLRLDGIIGAGRAGNPVERLVVIEPAGDVDPGPYGAVHVAEIIVEVAP